MLTVEIAKQCIAEYETDSGLVQYVWIDDAAAEILGKDKSGNELNLNSITELSDAAAKSLGKHKGGGLYMDSLTELSDAAAESFSKYKGRGMSLNGLRSLTVAAATSLAKYSGECLCLEDLDNLSEDAAKGLSKFKGRMIISLNRLSTPAAEILRDAMEAQLEAMYAAEQAQQDEATFVLTAEIAEQFVAGKLSSPTGPRIHQFTSIEDDAAEILGNTTRWLNLDGLTELSDAAAKSLSMHKDSLLQLKGLTRLSDAAAESLMNHKGPIELDRLTELSDTVAELLSRSPGPLTLRALASLTERQAEFLIEHEGGKISERAPEDSNQRGADLTGHLNLHALPDISDSVAEILSRYPGNYLMLGGLTELSDAAAESLSQYQGEYLELHSLKCLSDSAARSLASLKGTLCLGWNYQLNEMSDDAARFLAARDINDSTRIKPNTLSIALDNLPASAAQILRDAGHGPSWE